MAHPIGGSTETDDNIHEVSATRDLPTRKSYHPARKVFHFTTGLLCSLCNHTIDAAIWHPTIASIFLTVFTVETLRIRSPKSPLNKAVISAFRPFMRAHETRQFAGIAYYTFGVAFVTLFFPPVCANLAIIALAALDPVAAFAGSFFESRMPYLRLAHGKSLAGFVCAGLAGACVLAIALSVAVDPTLLARDVFMIAVLVAFVGAVCEFCVPSPQVILGTKYFPIGIDDNAIIPIGCALAVRYILRWSHLDLQLRPLDWFGDAP